MCRSRRELSNAYFLAKFGFDTAENEPFQVCPLSAYRSPRFGTLGTVVLEFSRGRKRKLILTARKQTAVEFVAGVRRTGAEVWREENKSVLTAQAKRLAQDAEAKRLAEEAEAQLRTRLNNIE